MPGNHRIKRLKHQGFALVASLTLMSLIVVLAFSLLTLATRSLASAGLQAEQAEARANARLALALALGQLQKQTGPDQRITTAADQLSSGNGEDSSAAEGRNHWTGVYRSWLDTVDRRPDPEFLSWLVSGDPSDVESASTAESSANGEDDVELVGVGTLGDSEEGRVVVSPLRTKSIAGGDARVAWWTGDQGVKAAISTPAVPEDSSFAVLRGSTQGAPRNAVELVEGKTDRPFRELDPSDPRLALVSDWQQSGFLASDIKSPRGLFHDLAPMSTGLLTNVRAGGFRKDLSMQLERTPSNAPKTPLYTVGGETGINLQELWCYYNLYKELRNSGGATFTTGGRIGANTPHLQVEASAAACRNDDEFHLKQPVIISYQMVLSFETRTTTVNGQAMNRLHVVADPVLTFWNPLDVPVVVPRSAFFSVKYWQIPYDLYIGVNGGPMRRFPLAASLSNATASGNGDANYLSLRVGELQQMVFKPGEVIKMSQSGQTLVKGSNDADHKLAGKSGFNYGGGVSLPVRDLNGSFIQVKGSDVIRYEARPNNLTAGKSSSSGNTITGGNAHTRHFSLSHHEYYIGEDRGTNSLGFGGMYLDWDFGNRRVKLAETRAETQPGTKPSGQRYYATSFPQIFKTIKDQDTRPLSGAELNTKAPFMMVSYNAKTENGSELGTRYLARFNPRAHHVDFYDLSQGERDVLPYEFTVEPLNSWRNRSLEVSTNGNAYFGGGMNAEFGNSFVTTHSVPREPLVSLAAFQHAFANGFEIQKPKYGYATLNGREPLLPQISHAIGNSMAPSMMSSDKTEGSLGGGRPMADHSYLANRALFDEWFLSGVSPQTVASFSTKRRAQRDVAQEFLAGTGKLPVVRYMPDAGGLEPSKLISGFFSGSLPNDTATRVMASLIRVDGLFNVNSTSVQAWKSMLGALKGREIVVRDETGAESIAAGDDDAPVANLRSPHSSVIDGSGNLDVKEPSQWVGRRTLSDEEIDALAEAIVREVRKRGPFLSLADFVNRRVGSDKNLARSGAIQSALDSRESEINGAFSSGTRAVGSSVASRFAFSEAEEGPAGYGSPGVVKQADILTPIAPVLSARSDSFIIRAYGESVDESGKVLARAWCEATVERDKQFLDTSDAPETELTSLDADVNKSFGRRYIMKSFRWLHPEEI